MSKPLTRLQQYQWCRAAIDCLTLFDCLNHLFEDDEKLLAEPRARLRNLHSSMANCELEHRTAKKGKQVYEQLKKYAESIIPGGGAKKVLPEEVESANRFLVLLCQLMFQDAVNTCPAFAYSATWRDVKHWLREAALLIESNPDTEPLSTEEVFAAEVYHKMNCTILGYPVKYGW